MKVFQIRRRLQFLRDYCDEIKSRRYDSPEQESQILTEDCRRVRLVAERLREIDAKSLKSLPSPAADPIADLSNLLNWIEGALCIEMQREKLLDRNEMLCSESDLSWHRRAKLLLNEHPDWVHTTIARELGAQQSTLVRSRLFSHKMVSDSNGWQILSAGTVGSGTTDENSDGTEDSDSQSPPGDRGNRRP